MKTIIAGSRGFNDYNLLCQTCNDAWKFTEIISGGARGADRLGERYATECGIPLKFFHADWKLEGLKAGPMRNIAMSKYAEALICFWDGHSKGTRHMIETAKKFNLKYIILTYQGLAITRQTNVEVPSAGRQGEIPDFVTRPKREDEKESAEKES